MTKLIFILSLLSAIVTGGKQFIENWTKGEDYLNNQQNTETKENKNDSTKLS